MASSFTNVFSEEEILHILNLPAVLAAKARIDARPKGSEQFSIELTSEIQTKVLENLGLDLSGIHSIPMRWIKGDTLPHIDSGAHEFDTTHLVYLTDSQGQFIVDGNNYPITKGCGYVFSEGLSHETAGTGSEPRLLLGPMSEAGLAVGGATIIYADGQTEIIYIRYDAGSGTTYKINNGSYNGISLPLTIVNTNISFTLQVLFETDLVLDSSIWYIICGSANIQFGSTSLKTDGTRPVITIDGVANYPGFIRNGDISNPGNNNIYVYNLVVTENGSTLINDAGWIGQSYFGKGATDNYIINCLSSGPIIDAGGGIVGGYSGSESGAELYIYGCSSSGNMGTYSGGIIGFYPGRNGGQVICQYCWSEGSIGQEGGGIFGYSATGNGAVLRAIQCYSTGAISGQYSGGIYGRYAGDASTAEATNCYSQGAIGLNAGGIFGADAGINSGTTPATNCYSSGTITTVGTGIYGPNAVDDNPTHCYVANGSWSDITANSNLTGTPNPAVGTAWITTGTNQPYEIRTMGYTPYTTNIITSTPDLNRLFSQSIQAGSVTISAVISDASGSSFIILKTENGNPSSYGTITMNSQTGAISTTATTAPGTYLITLRSVGSYHITQFNLTVTEASSSETPCCEKPLYISNTTDNTMLTELKAGNTLLGSINSRRGNIPYSALMNIKKAYAAKR